MAITVPQNIILRDIEDLKAYERNPRQHPTEQIDQLAAAITQWGWTIPVLIDDEDMIIAGHGRVMAAKKLGILKVPVIVAEGWSEDQKRAYVIADNQLTASSEWDKSKLAAELTSLKDAAFDLDLIGFSTGFISQLTEGKAPEIGDNHAPASVGKGAMLEWRDKMVPMDEEEVTLLDKALKKHIHTTRSRSWFIDNFLKGNV